MSTNYTSAKPTKRPMSFDDFSLPDEEDAPAPSAPALGAGNSDMAAPDPAKEQSLNHNLGLLALALMTPLAGAALGGKKGALGGGASALNAIGQGEQLREKREFDAAAAMKKALATEKLRAQGRTEHLQDQRDLVDYTVQANNKKVLPKVTTKNAKGQVGISDPNAGTFTVTDPTTAPVKPGKELTGKDKANLLDVDKRIIVEKLSATQAGSMGVTNQMQAELNKFKEAKARGDADGAIKAGEGMLKLLNSAQNPDAVGAEEAERLGSFLVYQKANVLNPGKFFGRDLDAFERQVEGKLGAMQGAISANQAIIDEYLGRQAPASSGPKVGDIEDGMEFMGGDAHLEKNWKPVKKEVK